jgi:c-di-GMP-binding flagellar brake protein YcgR
MQISTDTYCERRRFRRYKLTLNAFYRIDAPVYVRMWYGDQEFEAYTLDISEGGMCLLTALDIPVSATLSIKLTLLRLDRDAKVEYFTPEELKGEVRSKFEQDKKAYKLNVSFIQTDSVITDQISEFIISSR